MKLEEHVFRAIEAADRGETEHALLHACIAIDASAQKHFQKASVTRKEYIEFIRSYYWVLEPMTGGCINFDETNWSNIHLTDNFGKLVKKNDIAAFIYHALRCSQAHGNEIHPLYKLTPRNPDGTLIYHVAKGKLHIPETIIWGLISICVFAKINNDVSTSSQHFLSLGNNKFSISDWWGLEDSFRPIAKKHNPTRIKLVLGKLEPI